MADIAQISGQVKNMNKPRCDMPPRVGCEQLAEFAYFDHATDKVIYRCRRHKISVYLDDEELLESIDTVEEAMIREVMNA